MKSNLVFIAIASAAMICSKGYPTNGPSSSDSKNALERHVLIGDELDMFDEDDGDFNPDFATSSSPERALSAPLSPLSQSLPSYDFGPIRALSSLSAGGVGSIADKVRSAPSSKELGKLKISDEMSSFERKNKDAYLNEKSVKYAAEKSKVANSPISYRLLLEYLDLVPAENSLKSLKITVNPDHIEQSLGDAGLSKLSGVTSLELVEVQDFITLEMILPYVPNLERLIYTPVRGVNVKKVATILGSLKNLKELQITRILTATTFINKFLSSLGEVNTLTSFSIGGMFDPIALNSENLWKLSGLTELSTNNMPTQCLIAIMGVATNLESLKISSTAINLSIVKSIGRLSYLQSLSMNMKISYAEALKLFEFVNHMKSLESLAIDSPSGRDDIISAAKEALTNFDYLETQSKGELIFIK